MTSAAAPAAGDLQQRTLESLSYAVNYNAWLAELVRPYLGGHPLEVGSGLGELAPLWLAAGVPRLTLSDLDADRVDDLRSRYAEDPRVDVIQLDIARPPVERRRFSATVAFNVLEHIEDDAGALASMAQLLEPRGAVVVFVPAHPVAMSDFDRAIGHYRRYTGASLRAAAGDAGLRVEVLRHVNLPGLFAWLLGMKLLRRTPTDTTALRAYDRFVMPVARSLENRVSFPIGQSLLAVARVAA